MDTVSWTRAIERVRAGEEVVTAIVEALWHGWPKDPPPPMPQAWTERWNTTSPWLLMLDAFRRMAGTRFIGRWSETLERPGFPEGPWCSTHTREDAIALMEGLRDG